MLYILNCGLVHSHRTGNLDERDNVKSDGGLPTERAMVRISSALELLTFDARR